MRIDRKLVFGMILMIFLAACSMDAADKVIETEVKADSETAETEDTEKEEIELPELDFDETREVIDTLVEGLMNVYIDAGKEFQLADQPVTDEFYQSMREDLKAYATEDMIDSELNEIAQEFCYAGCDHFYFPTPTSYALRFTIYDMDGMRHVEYVIPENELNGSYEEALSLAYEDEEWKLNSFTRRAVENLELTKDEAGWLLQENGYRVEQFLEERKDNDRNVYVFQLLNNDHTIQVAKDTGYIIVDHSVVQAELPAENRESTSSDKEMYMQKLAKLEGDLSWIDEQYDIASVAEMRDLEEKRYKEWDHLLNEIYGVIQDVLPSSEMEVLRQEQREWILNRDTEAERGTDALGGGWQGLQYTINLMQLTKDRCYKLVEEYL